MNAGQQVFGPPVGDGDDVVEKVELFAECSNQERAWLNEIGKCQHCVQEFGHFLQARLEGVLPGDQDDKEFTSKVRVMARKALLDFVVHRPAGALGNG